MIAKNVAAWAGMVGPALFVAVFMIEGWLRPIYNPLSTYVSELALGARGWIQIVNFIIVGVLLLVWARGVAAEFREGKASRAGPVLVTIIAVSLMASGPFGADPAATVVSQRTLHGIVHGIFGALVFSLARVSCFVFFRRFHEDPQWQGLQWWTLAAGVTIVTAVIFLRVGQTPSSALHAWVGLLQRIALVTYMAWVFTFAWALVAHSRNERDHAATGIAR